MLVHLLCFSFFFFNDTATTEIYTLSLHDALPISAPGRPGAVFETDAAIDARAEHSGIPVATLDRKSTRLNSSHLVISYAVFCLKKKKKHKYCTLASTDTGIVRCAHVHSPCARSLG